MEPETNEPALQQLEEQAKGTYWEYLGCELIRMEPGKVVVALDVKEHHLNLIGILHGGVHTSLLDSAMGLAAMAARPGEDVVTSTLNVHFMAPVRIGRVTVTAETVHLSGRTVTAHSTLAGEDGRLCSMATASFRVVERKV